MQRQLGIVAKAALTGVRRAVGPALVCALCGVAPAGAQTPPDPAASVAVSAGLLERWAADVPGARVLSTDDPALGPLLLAPADAGTKQRGSAVVIGPTQTGGLATAPLTVEPLMAAMLDALPAAGWQVLAVQPALTADEAEPLARLKSRLAFALAEVDPAAGPVAVIWLRTSPAMTLEPLKDALPRLDLRPTPEFVPGEMGLAGLVLVDVRWEVPSMEVGQWLASIELPILWMQTDSLRARARGETLRALQLGLANPRLLRQVEVPGLQTAPRALSDGLIARVLGFLFSLTDEDARRRAYDADIPG